MIILNPTPKIISHSSLEVYRVFWANEFKIRKEKLPLLNCMMKKNYSNFYTCFFCPLVKLKKTYGFLTVKKPNSGE